MLKGGGSFMLGPNRRWLGPGGESVLHEADGNELMVFHAYDAQNGRPTLRQLVSPPVGLNVSDIRRKEKHTE